jgi:hypothetical protein
VWGGELPTWRRAGGGGQRRGGGLVDEAEQQPGGLVVGAPGGARVKERASARRCPSTDNGRGGWASERLWVGGDS